MSRGITGIHGQQTLNKASRRKIFVQKHKIGQNNYYFTAIRDNDMFFFFKIKYKISCIFFKHQKTSTIQITFERFHTQFYISVSQPFSFPFISFHNALPKWKLYSRNNGTDVIRQSPRQNSNKFQQQMETSLKRKKVKLVQWKLIFNQELIHAFSCEYNEVKFAEQERGVGIARGATKNNPRFLSAL